MKEVNSNFGLGLYQLYIIIIVSFYLLFMSSCTTESLEMPVFKYQDLIPDQFPTPDLDSFPKLVELELGRKLFYDPVLSSDSSISCSSCHKPALAFSDTVSTSMGVHQRIGTRNAISIANVVYQMKLLREGGVPTLEQQILVPIQEHAEFDNNILVIANTLNKIPAYVDLSIKAYNRLPDAFVITRSIAAFERCLFSGNSKYDHFLKGLQTLTQEEWDGMQLFNSSRTNCSLCHTGFLFTNQAYENNGLYPVYNDVGKNRLTGDVKDIGRFKIPSLRNVEVTFPYMHDGSLKTLESVIDHYNKGGFDHANKSPLIKPLFLNDYEKKSLVSFLKTLTDSSFLNNKFYRYP